MVISFRWLIGLILFTALAPLSSFAKAIRGNNTCLNLDTIPGSNIFYVSNLGSNSNDGKTASTPKQSLDSLSRILQSNASAFEGVNIGLETSSIFREEFISLNNITLSSFQRSPGGQRPKITGMDIIKDWQPTSSRNNVFEKSIFHSIALSNPRYSYIMIAEIDTALEKTNPIAAVKYLDLVSGINACETTVASFYTPDLTTNPVKVFIHPTEGAPGTNRFRYEAATRMFNVNGYYVDGATYENLFLQTSGNGYGMLAGGDNTTAKNIIFQGGGTHHLVMKSGMIDSCVFLPGPKGLADRIASVFYEAEGKDNNNKLSNSIFLDIPVPVYTHTNGAVNHKSLTIDKVFTFGNTLDASQGLSSADTDSVSVTNCYIENYPTAWYGIANTLNIRNSTFRNTDQAAIHILQPKGPVGQVNISDVLITTNGNDANQFPEYGRVAYGIRSSFPTARINISHSIIHGYSTWNQKFEPAVQAFQLGGNIESTGNIFICDVNDDGYMQMLNGFNSTGVGTATNVKSDRNVYILLRGKNFRWFVAPNISADNWVSFNDWQNLTGQDKNSLFLDLRGYPAGLQAIFTDPARGNWSFASTELANRVKAVGAGITNPPLFYPERPSIDGSLEYKLPGGFSSFTGANKSDVESTFEWKTFNETEFDLFTVENSSDSINFKIVDTLQASGNGKDNNYTLNHQHAAVARNYYRLKITRKDGTYFYSQVVVLKTTIRDGVYLNVYPNPFSDLITIDHPSRNNSTLLIYSNSGHLVRTVKVVPGSIRSRVSLSSLTGGAYFLQWVSGKENLTSVILK